MNNTPIFLKKITFMIAVSTFVIPNLGAECPKINDLPVLNSAGNNFYCAFDWIDTYPWTHEIPLEACIDKRYNLMDGTDWDTGNVIDASRYIDYRCYKSQSECQVSKHQLPCWLLFSWFLVSGTGEVGVGVVNRVTIRWSSVFSWEPEL